MKKLFFILVLAYVPLIAQEKIDFISTDSLKSQLRNYEQDGEFEKALDLINRVHPKDSMYCSSLTSKSYYLLNLDRFEEALSVTKNGIKTDCDKESKMFFYMNTGYAYNKLDRHEDAIELYDEALIEFPKSARLWYNKGVIYKETNRPAEATKCFINAIKYQPTYANAHFNLGTIIYAEEETSLGLMALTMSVFAKPDIEESLGKLSAINKELTTKNENKASHKNIDPDQGNFKQLDLILDNLVAIDENYKIDNKIPIPLVKQIHVFFEQLDNYKGNEGFWSQSYLPFFKWIKENDYFNEFIYLILYSNTNDDFQKIIKKENDNIVAFAEKAYNKWYEIIQHLNTELEEKDDLIGLYTYDAGYISGIGLTKNEKAVGKWDFYSNSGFKISEGNYTLENDRTGLWSFYDEFGKIKEENNYINGEENVEIRGFHPTGQLMVKYSMKNDKPHGNYKAYTYYGALKQEKTFVDGKLQGPYAAYFNTGKSHKEFETNYVDGEIDGEFIEYYSNGEVYSIMNYKKGIQEGKEIRYARNGKKSFEVEVVDNLAHGTYTTYHLNGQIQEQGQIEEGNAVGNWKNYDSDGSLITSYNYNNKGELDGEYIEYVDKKKHFEYTYRNGEIIAYTCYDAKGKELISKKKKKGKFYFKGFYLNGNLSNEGEYDIEGGKTGNWKEYYPSGLLKEEGSFIDNKQVGKYEYYHTNGEISQITNYNDEGETHGYSSYYYQNGQMRMQGWFQNGSEEGVWESYYKDGTLQSSSYYHNGELVGERKFFSVEGKPKVIEYITNNLLDSIKYFDQNQKLYDKINFHQDKEEYTITFRGINYPKEVESEYLNGYRNGKYIGYDIEGNISSEGNYLVGQEHGLWKWYKEGKLRTEANYQFGDLHGKLTRFTDQGKVDFVEFYEYGSKAGEWINHHSNGMVSVKEYFKNGELHGKKTLYNPNGNLQINLFYNRGKLIAYSYLDENQNEVPKVEIKNETANILAYYPNGSKAQEFSIKNGLYEGSYIVYHENGQIRYKIEYQNGLRDGLDETFYEDGTLKERNKFTQDDLDGKATTYHENGKLASSITYKLGKRHGEALYYNEKEELTKKELYYDGDIYEKETY